MLDLKDACVATLCIGEEMEELAKITHPRLQAYAVSLRVPFVVMRDKLVTAHTDLPVHYEKFQLYDLLDTYKRVIFIDTDAFPVKGCPDLFATVPEHAFGAFVVSPFTSLHDADLLRALQDNPEAQKAWDRRYFNAGVMVLSYAHQMLFELERGRHVGFGEQTQLNVNRVTCGVPLYDIGFKFNHTTVPAVPKTDSFILHYPGPDMQKKTQEIKAELKRRTEETAV